MVRPIAGTRLPPHRYHLGRSLVAGTAIVGSLLFPVPTLAQRGTFSAPPAGDVHFQGPVATFSALPACWRDGDFIVVMDTIQSYVCKGGVWQAGGAGAPGTPGAPGSKIYNGSGVPDAGLGVSGDYYIRTASYDLYAKSGSAWVVVVNLRGATGATGATGTSGANGADGAPGAPGAAGTKGDKGDKGDIGDAGAPGAAGQTGAQGIQGIQGVAGPTGSQGSSGATGAAGAQGTPGATGATGTAGADGIPRTIQDEGADLPQRLKVNFIGPGVTAADDSANSRTNVTILTPATSAAVASNFLTSYDATTGLFTKALGGTGDVVGAGVSGGQTVNGDILAGGALVLIGTANATRGPVSIDHSTLRLVREGDTPNGRIVDVVDATNSNQLMMYMDSSGVLHAYQNGGFEVDLSFHGFIAGASNVTYGFSANSRMEPVNNTGLNFFAGNTKTAAVSANGLATSVFTDTPPATCTASPAEIAVDVGTLKRICVCTATNTWKCATLS